MSGSKFLSQGLPLILLTVGGWLSLSYFVQGKIDVQEAQREYVDDHSTVQKQRAKKFNLEEELERLKRGGSLDYENKPLPRPKQD